MAQFQLSVSKTYTINTDDWGQEGRDQFAVALEKVGFDGKGQPSTQQCVDATRYLLEKDDDGVFWDAHIDLGEIEARDVKVVCISRQFDRWDASHPTEGDGKNVEAKTEGKPQVAPSQATAAQSSGQQKADQALSTSKDKPQNSPPVSPAPKIDDSKVGAIQGARDSTQVKK